MRMLDGDGRVINVSNIYINKDKYFINTLMAIREDFIVTCDARHIFTTAPVVTNTSNIYVYGRYIILSLFYTFEFSLILCLMSLDFI